MRPLVRNVDRLQRLATFEAAARLGSFSAAGRELGMAQPAVTRQVQALEDRLGIELFRRRANRVELTDVGQRLAATVDSGFRTIERSLSELTRIADSFVLAMPPGFAQQLVVPHLDGLQRALGDPDLHLWLYDQETDLESSSFDAAIRVGTGTWPDLEVRPLFGEQVTPVASPSLAEEWRLAAESSAEEILAAPLLHMGSTGRPWMSWSEWLDAFGLVLTPGRRRIEFNNYPTVLQQAVAGRGVALAWSPLTDDLIASGVLCRVGPTVGSARSYYLSWPEGRRSPAVDALLSWLDDLLVSTSPERP